jgi:hypothetical protein
MGVHTYNPNIQEVEAGGLGVWGQPGLLARPCIKKKKQKQTKTKMMQPQPSLPALTLCSTSYQDLIWTWDVCKSTPLHPSVHKHIRKIWLGTGGSHLKSYLLRRWRLGGSWFKASLGKEFMRPYLENTQQRAGGVAQDVGRVFKSQ